jgi:hypothetical protein
MELESKKAFDIYGHFNSTHEVYGVLMEEVHEFFEVVKEKPPKNKTELKIKSKRMILELEQIAEVCLRASKELKYNKIKHV